jgi:peptidoglycan/LPS O-acetylase OafA/YrhL
VAIALLPLPERRPSIARVVANLTMVQGVFGIGSVDPVYWSLQVELCFYLMVYGLMRFGWLRRVEWLLLMLVTAKVLQLQFLPAGTAAALRGHRSGALVFDGIQKALILEHAHSFLIGVMLLRLWQAPRVWHGVVIAFCLLVRVGAYEARVDLWAMTGFAVVLMAGARGWLRVLEQRWLVFLGTISYSLYLSHQNLGFGLIRWAEGRGINVNVAIAGATAVALLVASGLTFLVEWPAMRAWKARVRQGP